VAETHVYEVAPTFVFIGAAVPAEVRGRTSLVGIDASSPPKRAAYRGHGGADPPAPSRTGVAGHGARRRLRRSLTAAACRALVVPLAAGEGRLRASAARDLASGRPACPSVAALWQAWA
jgi:hypothetical protein